MNSQAANRHTSLHNCSGPGQRLGEPGSVRWCFGYQLCLPERASKLQLVHGASGGGSVECTGRAGWPTAASHVRCQECHTHGDFGRTLRGLEGSERAPMHAGVHHHSLTQAALAALVDDFLSGGPPASTGSELSCGRSTTSVARHFENRHRILAHRVRFTQCGLKCPDDPTHMERCVKDERRAVCVGRREVQ